MHKRDWSLVFFTTTTQASIGITAWLALAWLTAGDGLSANTAIALMPVLLALGMVIAATAISFMHLGSPLNAPYAIRNLATSWLSREILAINLYIASLLLYLAAGMLGAHPAFSGLFVGLAAATGCVLIWMMARIYMVPTIPAWNRWYTPFSFITATISLGTAGTLLIQSIGWSPHSHGLQQGLQMTLVLVLIVELLTAMIHHRQLGQLPAGFQKPDFDRSPYQQIFKLRLGILVMLLSCLIALQFSTATLYPGNLINGLVLLVVIIQEIIGRQLFYSSYYRLGV